MEYHTVRSEPLLDGDQVDQKQSRKRIVVYALWVFMIMLGVAGCYLIVHESSISELSVAEADTAREQKLGRRGGGADGDGTDPFDLYLCGNGGPDNECDDSNGDAPHITVKTQEQADKDSGKDCDCDDDACKCGCFDENMILFLENNIHKPLREIQSGDKVQTCQRGVFTNVVTNILHSQSTSMFEIGFEETESTIMLTGTHLVPSGNSYVPSKYLKVGDMYGNHKIATIQTVPNRRARGLITVNPDIMVNGICSTVGIEDLMLIMPAHQFVGWLEKIWLTTPRWWLVRMVVPYAELCLYLVEGPFGGSPFPVYVVMVLFGAILYLVPHITVMLFTSYLFNAIPKSSDETF